MRIEMMMLSLAMLMGVKQAWAGEPGTETAIVAGGCFWCLQAPFEALPGVKKVTVGYTGGRTANPTYEQVSGGRTGHVEAVMVEFDPSKISYEKILDKFWRQIDPTDHGGQFVDRGSQYRTAIFYADARQKWEAEQSRQALAESGRFDRPIATEIRPAGVFYPAENYHQGYYRTCPVAYERYREGSGREQFIRQHWSVKLAKENAGMERKYSKPRPEELKKQLTGLQYQVTQACGTEPPFQNEYWDNHREGLYVDAVSGEPLFSSRDKNDSGSGWPSFDRPLEPENLVEKPDVSHGMSRTEIRSKHGDSHLGHLFPDGPKPTGLRYCVNSAAMRFIPKEDLEQEGYGEYLPLFEGRGAEK